MPVKLELKNENSLLCPDHLVILQKTITKLLVH